MIGITYYVLLAGIGTTIAGLILQAAGRALFSRYKREDTKELAGVVGLRVSAIFGIAVGLIFASSTAHLMEVKRNCRRKHVSSARCGSLPPRRRRLRTEARSRRSCTISPSAP